jgi:DNA-directed RNA polymerase alpha subunit
MKCLDNPIEDLNIKNTITQKLKKNNILVIKDIWKLKRKDLKSLDFSDDEINQIIIKLQLRGLDLNKKVY